MARRKIDVSRFLDATPEPVESPQQRQTRISAALERAAVTKGAIIENRRENDRLVRNHRKARSDLYLNMNDLMAGIGHSQFNSSDVLLPEDRAILAGRTPRIAGQMLTEQFPTNHDDMIMNEMYQQQSRRPQQPQRPQRQVLQERVAQRPNSKLNLSSVVGTENWGIKKFLGETRGGDTVSVWKVHNKKADRSLDKMFRVESVASRIAMLLNETGNLNDTRVVGLISAYDKRDKLLKEARLLEKSADGKQMKTGRLRDLRAEINQLDYKLGI